MNIFFVDYKAAKTPVIASSTDSAVNVSRRIESCTASLSFNTVSKTVKNLRDENFFVDYKAADTPAIASSTDSKLNISRRIESCTARLSARFNTVSKTVKYLRDEKFFADYKAADTPAIATSTDSKLNISRRIESCTASLSFNTVSKTVKYLRDENFFVDFKTADTPAIASSTDSKLNISRRIESCTARLSARYFPN